MNKSIYEEALEILIDSFQDPQDEDNDCYMLDFEQMNNIAKTISQAQKQEKLLELYKELITVKDDMFDCCEIVDDEFYDIRKTETNLKQQIKELEK